jgi:hypothetical protein
MTDTGLTAALVENADSDGVIDATEFERDAALAMYDGIVDQLVGEQHHDVATGQVAIRNDDRRELFDNVRTGIPAGVWVSGKFEIRHLRLAF